MSDNIDIVHKLLDEPFWLPTIDSENGCYRRFEDDSPKGSISVMFSCDGDAHLMIIADLDPNDLKMSMRFRMPMIGGGQSPRVRNALLILAEAIRLDNEDHPQHREDAR